MNEDKPEWYSRVTKGPFPNEKFTAEMKKNVQMSVMHGDGKPKRRKYLQIGFIGGLLFLVILLAI